MKYIVRAAVRADLSALASFGRGDVDAWHSAQFAAEWGLAVSKIWIAEKTAPDRRGEAATRVGCLVRWAVADEMQVLNVVVDPAVRRVGVGLLLMQTALSEAQNLGLSQVHLEVRCDNYAAIGLYARLGFEICGRRRAYYSQSGTDAILMRCAMAPTALYK